MTTASKRAFNAGFDAYYTHYAPESNPFDPKTETHQYEQWQRGWQAAQAASANIVLASLGGGERY